MSEPTTTPRRDALDLVVNGQRVSVAPGSTILDACATVGVEVPTLCYLDLAPPINSCRVCVVEVEGSRTLVPACSRIVDDGMVVQTDSPRVGAVRRTIYELLASSVDLSLVEPQTRQHMEHYGVDQDRFAGGYRRTDTVKIEDDLYVRDYDKCIMCYRCVVVCGEAAQNTFAIDVAGRGLYSTISTEYDTPLPESSCVYCGNCVAVCPTGALMVTTEYDMRQAGTWDEGAQTVTRTVCSFCGVGCNLDLHVQDNRIVKVTSPADHDVTRGNLCIKGRFGYDYVHGTRLSNP